MHLKANDVKEGYVLSKAFLCILKIKFPLAYNIKIHVLNLDKNISIHDEKKGIITQYVMV